MSVECSDIYKKREMVLTKDSTLHGIVHVRRFKNGRVFLGQPPELARVKAQSPVNKESNNQFTANVGKIEDMLTCT